MILLYLIHHIMDKDFLQPKFQRDFAKSTNLAYDIIDYHSACLSTAKPLYHTFAIFSTIIVIICSIRLMVKHTRHLRSAVQKHPLHTACPLHK